MSPNKKRLRVSRPATGDDSGVNHQCHSNPTNLQPNDRTILAHPRIKVILWGHFYVEHPDAVSTVSQLVTALVAGRYMNNLVQYGIGRGSLIDVSVVDTTADDPAPHSLTDSQAQDQLIQWLRAGFITPAPAVNERNLLYLIIPPLTTILEPADLNFGAYHQHGQFNDDSDDDDLFWAIFRTGSKFVSHASGDALIRGLSASISHEMTEAFTDRDADGWITSNDCEICDLCEILPSFSYEGFGVPLYWSNWDRACIRGDKPVHLSRFLKAAAHPAPPPGGLRWLSMPRVGLETIAARMRSK